MFITPVVFNNNTYLYKIPITITAVDSGIKSSAGIWQSYKGCFIHSYPQNVNTLFLCQHCIFISYSRCRRKNRLDIFWPHAPIFRVNTNCINPHFCTSVPAPHQIPKVLNQLFYIRRKKNAGLSTPFLGFQRCTVNVVSTVCFTDYHFSLFLPSVK
jgi:hypothetical protein